MATKSCVMILALVAVALSINGVDVEGVDVGEALSLIQQDLAKATETLNHAGELLKNESDRGQWERYGTCVEEFRAAVSRNLPNAAAAVKSASYSAAVDELKATAQHADNCESQFAGSFASPFTAQIKAVKDFTFQAIAVIQKSILRRLFR